MRPRQNPHLYKFPFFAILLQEREIVKKHCLIVYYIIYRPFKEYFHHTGTSPLPVKN